MRKLGIFHVVFILLFVLAGVAVPYRTASAVGPTITDSTATPNMVSIFGDNMTASRSSPLGPNWTTVVAKLGSTPTSIKASLGDFFVSIMPADANIRTTLGASDTSSWDSFISNLNTGTPSLLSLSSGVYKKDVSLGYLISQAQILFSPSVYRRIIEQELRTGQKSITITAIDAGGTTTATVTVWVVDSQFMVRKGWNLRSTPVALADSTWSGILSNGNKTSIIGVGLKFDPSRPAAQQWQVLGQNDTVSPLDGIYIYATQDDALGGRLFRSATGVVQPASKSLTRGAWNLIGTAPDFTENFNIMTPSSMRGMLPVTTTLQSVSSDWVTAISPGEADTTVTSSYTYAGSTPPNLALGSYTWKFGQPGWSMNSGETPAALFGTLTNGIGVATGSPLSFATNSNNTVTVTTAGTFTVATAAGVNAIVSSGTATLTGSPISIGPNTSQTVTVTSTGTLNVLIYPVKGWTIPFGGYWVFIQSPMSGVTSSTIALAGKNQGVLTDDWMMKLLTLLP